MGAHQPYLYEAEKFSDNRFPTSTFDPKAVTRASWEPKPQKPKQDGPLISFNRHPDAHEAPRQRTNLRSMGSRTKKWIKYMRGVNLFLRILELNGAIGILVLMILMNHMAQLTAWVMRITAAVVMIHCVYGIYHLSRPARARTPASSAAYQLFSAISDLCVLPLYTYGALSVRNSGGEWGTLLSNENVMDVFIPALYYTLIGAGGLHLLSLAISLWLCLKFRQITLMPPDMNPLEDHLTSRRHKKNKSSVATTLTNESERRLSTPLENYRRSGVPYQDISRPPSVPFMATRTGSRDSIGTRDSRVELPSRHYQITPGNSPRNSATSADLKRMSAPPSANRSSYRGSYSEISLYDQDSRPGSSRPSTGTVVSQVTISNAQAPKPRAAKFSEAWYASESLINRTQERNRAMNAQNAASKRRAYEALNQRYDLPESDTESDNGGENDENTGDLGSSAGQQQHPNPLRSNPTPLSAVSSARPKTPHYSAVALSEVSLNDRRVSGSQDIADQMPGRMLTASPSKAKRNTWAPAPAPRVRNSSIQPEDAFYAKPYGELKSATPPIMVGGNRQVSSGNDYDMSNRYATFGRRNVSGKIAEEGLAGANGRYSRYSVLNDD